MLGICVRWTHRPEVIDRHDHGLIRVLDGESLPTQFDEIEVKIGSLLFVHGSQIKGILLPDGTQIPFNAQKHFLPFGAVVRFQDVKIGTAKTGQRKDMQGNLIADAVNVQIIGNLAANPIGYCRHDAPQGISEEEYLALCHRLEAEWHEQMSKLQFELSQTKEGWEEEEAVFQKIDEHKKNRPHRSVVKFYPAKPKERRGDERIMPISYLSEGPMDFGEGSLDWPDMPGERFQNRI